MADLDSLIGFSISLITLQDVRYDGVLFSINTKEASIVLRDVTCKGTEDRVTDLPKRIPGSDKATPFVTFPGNEIKDLFVHEEQTPKTTAPAKSSAPAASSGPPAKPSGPSSETQKAAKQESTSTLSSSHATHADKKAYDKPKYDSNNSQHQNHSSGGRGQGQGRGWSGQGQSRDGGQQGRGQGQGRRTQDNRERDHSYAPQSNAAPTNAGTGEHLLKSREQKPFNGRDENPTSAVKTEFDFTAGLKTFNKEAVLAEVASTTVTPQDMSKYNKDDFFDSFTSDSKQEGGRPGRLTYAEERKLNQDTFGISSLRSGSYRGRGGGRGRGRGSGGGGGSGRGGSYNRDYNDFKNGTTKAT